MSVGVYFLERKSPIILQAMNRIDLVRQLPCTSKVLIIRAKKHEWVGLFMILIKYSFFYNDVTAKSLKVGIDNKYKISSKSKAYWRNKIS